MNCENRVFLVICCIFLGKFNLSFSITFFIITVCAHNQHTVSVNIKDEERGATQIKIIFDNCSNPKFINFIQNESLLLRNILKFSPYPSVLFMLHIFLLKTFFAYEKIYYEPEMGDCTPDICDRVCFQAVTEPCFVEALLILGKRIY